MRCLLMALRPLGSPGRGKTPLANSFPTDEGIVYTHDVLTEETAEKTYTEQAQPNHPVQHLNSWGSYLPHRSISQNSQMISTCGGQLAIPLMTTRVVLVT
jgi:hypothetical protein